MMGWEERGEWCPDDCWVRILLVAIMCSGGMYWVEIIPARPSTVRFQPTQQLPTHLHTHPYTHTQYGQWKWGRETTDIQETNQSIAQLLILPMITEKYICFIYPSKNRCTSTMLFKTVLKHIKCEKVRKWIFFTLLSLWELWVYPKPWSYILF